MANEEEPVSMEEQEDNSVRMAGYLDKRGKLKLMSTWKRYWFVLKDQLLLYYKSQLECINLSACRGSLNMGLASCVRPGAHRGPPANGNQGYTIEVVTRTQVITLRTKDRVLQEQWLKALLESMALPNISNPLRNSGGPMHFRYSLDNLPIVDEHETEEKVKEKQRTLPNRTSVTRHESVLGRIKKMGGQTYGGSLDTILKRRPNNVISQHSPQRSPQQPKIPKIKAVDRMLGLQHDEQEEEDMDDREAGSVNSDENSTKNSSNLNLIPEGQCLSGSRNSVSKDEISNKGIKVKVENPKGTKLKLDCVTDVNTGNQKLKISVVSSDENQNHEHLNVAKTNESKDIITTVPKDKHIIFVENEEVVVENRLYEKSKTDENEQDSIAVINNLYEKAKLGIEDDEIVENKLYDLPKEEGDEPNKSEEKLCNTSKLQKLSDDDKMYETVPVCVDSTIEVQKTSDKMGEEEEDYYCKYDKVSLMQSLSDKNSSPEPDLPPRPSAGTNDLPKTEQTQKTKTDDEDGDYDIYYETTESLNAKHSSPSQLLSTSGDGSPSEKKRLRFKGKIKLKKKKSPSKESVASEDVNSDGKKKRKMSFLRRVLKHYRKKPEANSESSTVADDRGSSDEPEYETVEYAVGVAKLEETADKATDTAVEDDASRSPEREVHKDKLFGTKSLLTEQAMLELRMKLKERDDTTDFSTSVSAIDENIEGYELVTSDDIPDKKPVPTPRPSKQKSGPDEKDVAPEVSRYHCNDSINRPNKPPSLPPRRVARPRSPWHDVPTNNSPVYGNFLDLGINVTDKTEESSEQAVEKQPAPEAGEWDEELQDELLGTPRGFAYIQNKWKAAEKSGEWDKVFQKSPPKERSPDKHSSTEELKMKQGRRSVSSESVVSGEGESKTMVPTVTSDIYSDVNKPQLSAKTIIKCLNSQSDRNSNDLHRVEAEEKHNCVLKQISEVDAVECKINKDLELHVGNIKTNGHDKSDSKTNNSNTGTVHIEGCDFIDDDVILRKSQMYTNSSHTNQNIISNKTDQFRIVNGESQNEHIFSSHVNEICGEGILKESRNIIEVSSQQDMFTTQNYFCQQNTGVFKESRPMLGHQDTEEYDIMPRLNRHSDELNLLLAQLAEITSAPLLPQGAATSLVDLPEGRKPKIKCDQPSQSIPAQPESFVLGPIRRRRHSDPDYDVPRPHGSLLHLLASNRISNRSQNQSGQDGDVIEATRFFGEADLTSNSTRSSLSLRHSVISEVDDQSDASYYVSMAPDSLEVPSTVDRSM